MNISEFRKDIKNQFDKAATHQLVAIERGGVTFILLTMWDYNEAIVSAAKDGVSKLITDEVSSNVRPDITHLVGTDPKKTNHLEKIEPVASQLTSEFDVAVEAGKSVPICCTRSKPCQHWQFDGQKEAWVNSITGEERGVA